MFSVLKTVPSFLLTVIIIGLLMKVANYVGESIGIYKFLQNLWKRVKK